MLLLSLPEASRTPPLRLFTASLLLDRDEEDPEHDSRVVRQAADVRIERFPSPPTATVETVMSPEVLPHSLSTLFLNDDEGGSTRPSTTTRDHPHTFQPQPQPQHHLLDPSEQSPFHSSHQRRKKVAFDKVYIREHSITVGDHAWRKEGRPPIQLDWPHSPVTLSISIEDWEGQRQKQGRAPPGHLPRMDLFDRQRRLRNVAGINQEELLLMEREYIAARYVEWHRAKLQALCQPSPTNSTSTTSSRLSCCGGV